MLEALATGLGVLVLTFGGMLVASRHNERKAIDDRFAANLARESMRRHNEDLQMRLDDLAVELAKLRRLRSVK